MVYYFLSSLLLSPFFSLVLFLDFLLVSNLALFPFLLLPLRLENILLLYLIYYNST